MSLEAPDAPSINMRRLFYPKWWLKTVGGFWSAYDYPPDDTSNLVNKNPVVVTLESEYLGAAPSSMLYGFLSYAAVAVLAGAVGLYVGQQQQQAYLLPDHSKGAPTGGVDPSDQTGTSTSTGVELGSLSRAAVLALHATSSNRRGYEAI